MIKLLASLLALVCVRRGQHLHHQRAAHRAVRADPRPSTAATAVAAYFLPGFAPPPGHEGGAL